MDDNEYKLNRNVSDFFDEALGLGLAEDIKLSQSDRYLPGKEIARGGMKSIESTVDTLTGREVAKALLIAKDDPEKTERFFHEARICASLEHPNIVPVYDTGFDKNGLPFFTMRLLGGQTLQKKVKNAQSSVADLIDVFVKICDAVSYAHSQGIIHRDLKPDNIQIGGFGEVQVCDWGLACSHGFKTAHSIHESDTKEYILPVTLDGMIKGTPGYLAPEQASSEKQELTAAADIYSLGAILYFILTGKAPLEDCDTLSSIQKTLAGDITPIKVFNPDASHSLTAICNKAMAVEIQDRYQSVEELKNDLLKYQHGFPTSAEEAGAWGALKLLIKRNQRIASLILVFFLVFNSALVLFLLNLSEKEKEARRAEALAIEAADQARDSEQATLEAMSMLAASEKQTRETLENLQKMTDEKKLASQKAAPRFLREGKMSFNHFEHYKALEQLNQAIELHPNIATAHEYKGRVLMSLLRYQEAEISYLRDKSTRNTFLNFVKEIKTQIPDPAKANYQDILTILSLYKKYSFATIQIEELFYSPALDFLSTEQRQDLAVDAAHIFQGFKKSEFNKMLPVISNSMPLVLYKTGLKTFDLRKHRKIKTYMIRGHATEVVMLPKVIIPSPTLEDIDACPNLKQIYISSSTELDFFKNLKVPVLNYKDIPQ
ncbi:protein kinase [Lentisphaera marina]|uniref:serine/threonine protein kinase n=1 Tax=Lentisphaera marina TaxID=1111041 RepID=UPI002366FE2A|nr:protein kinase [Lentisphaera marina]MDD7987280.1 protein kinase [Lentisphaera marina]